ncbi:P-loop containing nucleoside triphosphate hydrolase protein [Hygrophoropsis aurantiaca]|uniref:P-loop containing nucleoside triphosphate hydrolase protein n=1 Tax=Hygrophoropsis aurantiaca TaxID=72124 RepID=A0ACB8A7P7_9AGAM|nr:P-loop containing nucleoside triphosphate hydrolase protein [Hygrophoropsis aurantiaca]
MRNINAFGGPIVYLIVTSVLLFTVLVLSETGSLLPWKLPKMRPRRKKSKHPEEKQSQLEIMRADVIKERKSALKSENALHILSVTKQFNGKTVVDDLSLGIPKDTIFAMLGPNGAGKTTTFNIIRGDISPDSGDVPVTVARHPRIARLSLGVCPQFTAIDSQLTGLPKDTELDANLEALMDMTSLARYADRLANKLSGGNKRKLALAIALIGNPSVLLIDEFYTGVDAKIKREMWGVLRNAAIGKVVVITTHSMEEAAALANKVGILSKQILAVSTTESLSARYSTYQIQFSCSTREDTMKAQVLMSRIPGAKLAEDVATRYEIPLEVGGGGLTLAGLFEILSTQGTFAEYSVEEAPLESVFLKVIKENKILEADSETV